MKYMIHTCSSRYWYVEKYLIPSMLEQGIEKKKIIIHLDDQGDGNLRSTLKSFDSLPRAGDTWHLQDDVILCSQFKARTERIWERMACGFCSPYDKHAAAGPVAPDKMWYSFPCIKIPNKYAHEFVSWIANNDDENDCIFIGNNMFDDSLFKKFMERKHPEETVINISPNLVDNIDYLIGGSVISNRKEIVRARYFAEPELIEGLKEKLG